MILPPRRSDSFIELGAENAHSDAIDILEGGVIPFGFSYANYCELDTALSRLLHPEENEQCASDESMHSHLVPDDIISHKIYTVQKILDAKIRLWLHATNSLGCKLKDLYNYRPLLAFLHRSIQDGRLNINKLYDDKTREDAKYLLGELRNYFEAYIKYFKLQLSKFPNIEKQYNDHIALAKRSISNINRFINEIDLAAVADDPDVLIDKNAWKGFL